MIENPRSGMYVEVVKLCQGGDYALGNHNHKDVDNRRYKVKGKILHRSEQRADAYYVEHVEGKVRAVYFKEELKIVRDPVTRKPANLPMEFSNLLLSWVINRNG